MSRAIKLNKTSTKKIQKWLKNHDFAEDSEVGQQIFNVILSDVKNIKDCSECNIVDFYLEIAAEMFDSVIEFNDDFYIELKERTRTKLANKYTNKSFDNNIDTYFNEVKREYILHPQNESNDLEFLPENRDIFIKNNLKLVIECAKRYQNLGLPFEDLIQIGNYGLLTAFDKFDKDRANLRFAIIKLIKASELEEFTYVEAENIIKKGFTYSKNLDATLKKIPKEGFINKQEFISWVGVNIKTAVFASVAFQWIRAYILLELNKCGKIIRVPKSAQKNGKAEAQSITIINLDSMNPHTDDYYHDNQISDVANEEFAIEDESIENMEKQNVFKGIVEKLMFKLNAFDKRILQKRFGINMPFQLSVSEIAESEGISSNKVKYSLTNSLKIITNNINEADKKTIIEMLQ